MNVDRGSVVLVALDPALGHEQRGTRPAVVVSDPAVLRDARYPLLTIVPLTGTPGNGVLYPGIDPGRSGLRKRSWALVDQIRSLDKRRALRVFGRITAAEMSDIDEGLRLYLGLG